MVDSCLLFLFSSGTGSGHLEEYENHYTGQFVKAVNRIGYHGVVHQRGDERGCLCVGGRYRGRDIVQEET